MSKSNIVFTALETVCMQNNIDIDCAHILAEIIDENHSIDDFDQDDLKEHIETIEGEVSDGSTDFTFDFDGNEYRIIAESSIWGIYVETIKDIVNDCYDLKLDSIPDFIAWSIDWEETAKNAYVDGYGHTFSGYDGSEIEVVIDGTLKYYVFRTN